MGRMVGLVCAVSSVMMLVWAIFETGGVSGGLVQLGLALTLLLGAVLTLKSSSTHA